MKPHVKLAKNEQVWHGVSSSYFSIFSFLFFFFSFSSSCRNSLLGIFNN